MSFRFPAIVFLACSAYAQPGAAPAFHVQNVTTFVQYYSVAPEAVLSVLPQKNTGAAGASATLVYTGFNERSGVSLSYTPSYIAPFRALRGNNANHLFSITGRAGPNTRLRFNYSASGALSYTSDILFTPTQIARLAAVSGTASELGSAVVTGDTANNEIATALAEASGAGGPIGLGVYGDRLWNVSALTGVRYMYTPRLSLYVSLGASRSQHFNRTVSPGFRGDTYLIPYTLTGTGRAGLSYMLSQRTRVGLDLQSIRSYSRVQDSYGSGASLSLARIMGPHWFLNLQAGAGMVNMIRSSRPVRGGLQPTGGGGVGFRTFAHTFFFSVDRQAGDAYALGRTSSLISSAAWMWGRPGNPWSVSGEASDERLSGAGYPPFHARRGLAGINRRLGAHFALSLQYAYLSRYELNEQTLGGKLNLHTGRLSFVWEPYGSRRGSSSAE